MISSTVLIPSVLIQKKDITHKFSPSINLATYRISFNKPKHCNIDITILQMENPWLIYSVQEAFWEPAALEGGDQVRVNFQCFVQDQLSLPGNFQLKGTLSPSSDCNSSLSRLNVTSVISTWIREITSLGCIHLSHSSLSLQVMRLGSSRWENGPCIMKAALMDPAEPPGQQR